MPKIVLIGDSTIDNQHWVNPGETVTEQLQLLRPEDNIVNLAMDGFTTGNVLHGGYKDKAVKSSYHTHTYFKPFNQLCQHGNAAHVVLSVGGNDFREKLQGLINLPPESRLDTIETIINGLASNYINIIQKIKETVPKAKISVMLQYTPHAENDMYCIFYLMLLIANKRAVEPEKTSFKFNVGLHLLFGMSKVNSTLAINQLHGMMSKVYAIIFPFLIRHNINVIDLASSFNCHDKHLYSHQIEPSAKGGALIARLIDDSINASIDDSVLLARPSDDSGASTMVLQLEQASIDWTPGGIWKTFKHDSSL